METMVGSQRHRSPGVGGGVPASLSGGGLPQSTSECTKSTFTVSTMIPKLSESVSFTLNSIKVRLQSSVVKAWSFKHDDAAFSQKPVLFF